jgi:hypothetical protein
MNFLPSAGRRDPAKQGGGASASDPIVIASEGKQSSYACRNLDCFVASLLAMTLSPRCFRQQPLVGRQRARFYGLAY